MSKALLKMSTRLIKFKIKDGKIHIKCPNVTSEQYEKIATQIHRVVNQSVIQNNNFNASIKVEL